MAAGDGGERRRAGRAGRGGDPLHDPRARPDRGRPSPRGRRRRRGEPRAGRARGPRTRRARARRPCAARHQPAATAGAIPTRADLAVELVVYDGALAHALAFARPTSEDIVAATRRAPRARRRPGGGGDRRRDVRPPPQGRRARRRPRPHGRRPGEGDRHAAAASTCSTSRPPTHEARVRVSAWSCAHGSADGAPTADAAPAARKAGTRRGGRRCGRPSTCCATGASSVMDRRGGELLRDPWAARDAYLDLLLGARSWDNFVAEHVVGDAPPGRRAPRRAAQRAA